MVEDVDALDQPAGKRTVDLSSASPAPTGPRKSGKRPGVSPAGEDPTNWELCQRGSMSLEDYWTKEYGGTFRAMRDKHSNPEAEAAKAKKGRTTSCIFGFFCLLFIIIVLCIACVAAAQADLHARLEGAVKSIEIKDHDPQGSQNYQKHEVDRWPDTIQIFHEIEVQVSDAQMFFPNGEFKRGTRARVVGSVLARGFFIRYCNGDLAARVKFGVIGHGGPMITDEYD